MQITRKEQFKIKTNVLIEVHEGGKLVSRQRRRNLVTASGRDIVRDLLGGLPTTAPTHIALGTNNTAVADGDTDLNTEQYRDIITARRSFTSKIQFQLYVNQASGNGYTYTEAGIFNVLAGVDRLLARVTFSPIAKTVSNTITLSWDISIASS